MNTTVDNILSNAIAKAEQNETFEGFPPLDKCSYNAEFQRLFYNSGLDGVSVRPITIEPEMGRAIVRTDNHAILGIMKKRYAICNNEDLIVPVQEALEDTLPKGAMNNVKLIESTADGGSVARFGYHFDGLGHEIRQLSGSATQLNFMVRVVNSFGGQNAIRVQAGALDLFCTNGMTSDKELGAQNWGHTAGFKPEYIKPWLTEQIAFYETKVKVWEQWANREITPEQAQAVLDANYPASESEIKRAEKKGKTAGEIQSRKARAMMEQLDTEFQKRGTTVWALYSALTYYSSHNSEKFKVKNSSKRDNVERTLIEREKEVLEVERSESFQELAVV